MHDNTAGQVKRVSCLSAIVDAATPPCDIKYYDAAVSSCSDDSTYLDLATVQCTGQDINLHAPACIQAPTGMRTCSLVNAKNILIRIRLHSCCW